MYQVCFNPTIVKYKSRDQEMKYICQNDSLSLIQIVFDESVLIEKVRFLDYQLWVTFKKFIFRRPMLLAKALFFPT